MNLVYNDFLKLDESRIINPGILQAAKISNVSIDSRKCKKNDIFFAIKGENFDGHNFIIDVIKKGVKVIVASKNWFFKNKVKKNKVSFVVVADTLKALGMLASIYRSKFLIPIIAVGGSNGKTTTKDLISYVLSKRYNVLKTRANYNNAIGVPLTLFNIRKQHEICVIEIGTNHFGEIENLCKIVKPQFGVLTNIGKEHLEFLKNLKGVIKEEFELVRYLKNNNGMFFLYKDDKHIKDKINVEDLKIFSFSSAGRADVMGKIKGYNGFFPKIEIKSGNTVLNATLNMIGKQGFASALCAASVGFFFEIDPDQIKMAITEHKIESKKRNDLQKINGAWVLDDTYNSNPDSVKVALDNVRQLKIKGRKHIVLGDMLELGQSSKKEHYEIGKYVKKLGFLNLYTYGKESYNTFMGAKGVKNNFYFKNKGVIPELLKASIKEGDLVFVKGSRAMKMEEIIESIK